MLSVPERHRPLALALTSVCVHIFGDVPSPVITGDPPCRYRHIPPPCHCPL